MLRACGRHTREGRADPGNHTLCLIIDSSRPAGARVTGSYKTNRHHGRHDCAVGTRRQVVPVTLEVRSPHEDLVPCETQIAAAGRVPMGHEASHGMR